MDATKQSREVSLEISVLTPFFTSAFERPSQGSQPLVKISKTITPKVKTSVFKEKVKVVIVSGANHFIGNFLAVRIVYWSPNRERPKSLIFTWSGKRLAGNSKQSDSGLHLPLCRLNKDNFSRQGPYVCNFACGGTQLHVPHLCTLTFSQLC